MWFGVRLSEQAGKDTVCNLESYRIIQKVEPGELPLDIVQTGPNRINLKVPSNGIRELYLSLQ